MSSGRPLLDQVFILRFWREDEGGDAEARWRVLVRNINTRNWNVVDDVQRAFAIVASSLGGASRESGGQDQSTDERPEGTLNKAP